MNLPSEGEEEPTLLSEAEIRQIAHSVFEAENCKRQKKNVNAIFLTQECDDDSRVEGIREALNQEYDGVLIRSYLRVRKKYPDRGHMVMHTSSCSKSQSPNARSLSGFKASTWRHIKCHPIFARSLV